MRRIRQLLRYFEATERFVIRYQALTDTTEKKPEPIPETPPENPVVSGKPVEPSPLQKKVEQLVLAADLEGMTLDQLYEQIPEATMVALKQIRDSAIILLNSCRRSLVCSEKEPRIMNVPHELPELQRLVGGMIEVAEPFDDDIYRQDITWLDGLCRIAWKALPDLL